MTTKSREQYVKELLSTLTSQREWAQNKVQEFRDNIANDTKSVSHTIRWETESVLHAEALDLKLEVAIDAVQSLLDGHQRIEGDPLTNAYAYVTHLLGELTRQAFDCRWDSHSSSELANIEKREDHRACMTIARIYHNWAGYVSSLVEDLEAKEVNNA